MYIILTHSHNQVLRDESGAVRGGSVAQLVAHLADGSGVPERAYIEDFLLVHTRALSSTRLMRMLISRYKFGGHVDDDDDDDDDDEDDESLTESTTSATSTSDDDDDDSEEDEDSQSDDASEKSINDDKDVQTNDNDDVNNNNKKDDDEEVIDVKADDIALDRALSQSDRKPRRSASDQE
jgi:hypothetical protein